MFSVSGTWPDYIKTSNTSIRYSSGTLLRIAISGDRLDNVLSYWCHELHLSSITSYFPKPFLNFFITYCRVFLLKVPQHSCFYCFTHVASYVYTNVSIEDSAGRTSRQYGPQTPVDHQMAEKWYFSKHFVQSYLPPTVRLLFSLLSCKSNIPLASLSLGFNKKRWEAAIFSRIMAPASSALLMRRISPHILTIADVFIKLNVNSQKYGRLVDPFDTSASSVYRTLELFSSGSTQT